MSELAKSFKTLHYGMLPTREELLTRSYKYWRQQSRNPQRALANARRDVDQKQTRYPQSSAAMRGGTDWKVGNDSVFWCERPDDYLRRVGFVDEIPNESSYRSRYMIDHKGWYLRDDDYGGEVARGVVFQLPANKGQCRYISAIADPCNNGPAILSLELFDNLKDAARNADSLAEKYAESEREYNAAFCAGTRYAELGAEIAEQRKATLLLIREVKSQCAALRDMPQTRKIIESAIRDYLRETESARDKRAELVDQFGNSDAFKEGANN